MTKEHQTTAAAGWHFDNSYARLPRAFFAEQAPTRVSAPKIALFNARLAGELGLDAEALSGGEGAEIFAGNRIPEGAQPIAQAYAGHQFGHFTMLGDGRAVLLGEQLAPGGARFDIQLKGAGRTPYSRGGDGRAALGPMLREYVISEAMHALGIPTTRSLAVTTTGNAVIRESELTGAVLTRVAASHLRVGTFQYVSAARPAEELGILVDYALERHYPDHDREDNRALALLREVVARQAALIAKWQLVGFVHGVMNTDNMAISGETIDYGPCAFMDAFDTATVFSSIDRQGRYAYGNQPQIAAWNLARLAEALLPVLAEDEERAVELAEEAIAAFPELYRGRWLAGMRAKLGLFGEEAEDEALVQDLLALMQRHRADYTDTFLALTHGRTAGSALLEAPAFAEWRERWQARRGRQAESAEDAERTMRAANPAVIPRNHRVEEALAAAEQGDYGVLERLLAALSDPYAHAPGQAAFAALPEPAARPYRTYCGT
ncbi:YdiU family protein [Paenibacillus sp. MWE-103]|uniref:Protein nucleotidyltransferase YdiU n=1 Tax=Paenibacillus artemisiicola TaxID=1172618 RepID=A0ABS3W8Q6_9BACL|nr:YdiU family protein [Paenibacillus artemisiicola]MBO7744658.1 YdiU family protein [Paenibacillus artemisiicola]